ncbi:MFS general substrate transporter [Eremomyces bilateralis CBS 781.70]|uniref:MFS general substrate transporter n=1 Tax=Eremomyces bilateralis CBS 781.70 TaxID=1392243 RepID=A0A6G1FZ84_9PEZI|nr:MFS general substrate transporter [Eremomyces bilateralis CBS 781.70]KAF1810986.1 MFS general substrate transporter [Eremomyces bilateralis CBS 781.70]
MSGPGNMTMAGEMIFLITIMMSAMLSEYFTNGFLVIMPQLHVALDFPESTHAWTLNAFTLTVACFILPMGHLIDAIGEYAMFHLGIAWFYVTNLITGFSVNYTMFLVLRAISALGPAAFLPAGLSLLGKAYRPAERKTWAYVFYGASFGLGYLLGSAVGGMLVETMGWSWFFFIGALISTPLALISFWYIIWPWERVSTVRGQDWLGLLLLASSLGLSTFAILLSPHTAAKWASPLVYSTFIAGVALLAAFAYVEWKVAAEPLIPFDILKVTHMRPLALALLCGFASYGVLMFHLFQHIYWVYAHRNATIAALWFMPRAIAGMLIPVGGWLLIRRFDGKYLLVVSSLANIIAFLSFLYIKDVPSYWVVIFLPMICIALGFDLLYAVSTVFIMTNFPRRKQGLAAALIHTMYFLGMSLLIAFGHMASEATSRVESQRFRHGTWFGVASSVIELVIAMSMVTVPKAVGAWTFEEKEDQAPEHGEHEELRPPSRATLESVEMAGALPVGNPDGTPTARDSRSSPTDREFRSNPSTLLDVPRQPPTVGTEAEVAAVVAARRTRRV